jgi:uncharacterized protein YdeI (YjbR/CyaY-like superfamily)
MERKPKSEVSLNIMAKKNKIIKMNPKVDFYFHKAKKWRNELEKLREIVLDTPLTEELKWGVPCYTFEGHNVVLIHDFKEYCAVLFVKGVLLKDPEGILIQQTKNVQAGRHLRFTNVGEIIEMEPILKAYIREAIEVEKAGLKVRKKETSEYEMPEELQDKLDEDAKFKKAFNALTPGRQHGYIYYFSQPKLSKTREAMIEKYTPQILKGKGWSD